MKIIEALEKYSKNQALKVGSKEGNGYFYCGDVGDFIENLNAYSDIMHDHFVERYENAKENSETVISRFCSEVFQVVNKGMFTSDYISSIKPIFGRIGKVVNTEANAKNLADRYIPLIDRSVVDSYYADNVVDFDCLILIVDGFESGKFWCMEEAGDFHIGLNSKAEDVLNKTMEAS